MNKPVNDITRRIYMTAKETALYTRIPVTTLKQMRYLRQGPAYHNPTGGKVLYELADVDAWLDESRTDPVIQRAEYR